MGIGLVDGMDCVLCLGRYWMMVWRFGIRFGWSRGVWRAVLVLIPCNDLDEWHY